MNVSKTQLYSTETFFYMMSELSSSHFLAGLRFVFRIQSQKTAGVDIIRFHSVKSLTNRLGLFKARLRRG